MKNNLPKLVQDNSTKNEKFNSTYFANKTLNNSSSLGKLPGIYRRKLGDHVGWEKAMKEKNQIIEERKKNTLAGKKKTLENEKYAMSDIKKNKLYCEILECIKKKYSFQREGLIRNEMERELKRQVNLKQQVNDIARKRLMRQYEEERIKYRKQIERTTEDCEMSLVAKMVEFNFLR